MPGLRNPSGRSRWPLLLFHSGMGTPGQGGSPGSGALLFLLVPLLLTPGSFQLWSPGQGLLPISTPSLLVESIAGSGPKRHSSFCPSHTRQVNSSRPFGSLAALSWAGTPLRPCHMGSLYQGYLQLGSTDTGALRFPGARAVRRIRMLSSSPGLH